MRMHYIKQPYAETKWAHTICQSKNYL
jgi:hypothetical protein